MSSEGMCCAIRDRTVYDRVMFVLFLDLCRAMSHAHRDHQPLEREGVQRLKIGRLPHQFRVHSIHAEREHISWQSRPGLTIVELLMPNDYRQEVPGISGQEAFIETDAWRIPRLIPRFLRQLLPWPARVFLRSHGVHSHH